jgi:hypothetical protein
MLDVDIGMLLVRVERRTALGDHRTRTQENFTRPDVVGRSIKVRYVEKL